ncbi:LysM peptidoglycan-binding domain-containing protein [bacterium]|nr:LysM peptidoglycan-binding domain-containing protein [bacterium]MDY3757680.1 LysM peptidoglycan-binding domain-containing protein [Bacilli bacterium]
MNEAHVLDKEFLFKSSIYEITSISIEDNHDINGSKIEGEFIISGDYRLHEISINKEDFCFKLPYTHELPSNINLDTVELEITDFNYEFNNNDELKVHVEYILTAEEGIKLFESEAELNKFLDNNDAEIIDLKESTRAQNEVLLPETKEETETPSKIDENMILGSINEEEKYVKYHIHTVTMNDSIESITKEYNISLNTLKKYNTFENLELNMKLLIPDEES